jgi:hypothetical protein
MFPLFPNISKLRVSGHHHQPQANFLPTLEQVTRNTIGDDVPLPKLRSLEWGSFISRSLLDESVVREQAHRLFQTRQKLNLPLDEVKTHIIKEPDWRIALEIFTRNSFPDIGDPI